MLLDFPVALGRLLDPGVLAVLWGQESRPGLDFQGVPEDPLGRSLQFAPCALIVTTLFATESVTFASAARARSVVSTSSGVFVETCVSFRWKMSFTLTLSMRRLGVLMSGLKKVPPLWTCTSPVGDDQPGGVDVATQGAYDEATRERPDRKSVV